MSTIQQLSKIFEWFQTGKYPTQEQFHNTFFSFWHKQDQIPTSAIGELDELLNSKYDRIAGELLENRMENAEERLAGHDRDISEIHTSLETHTNRLDEHDVRLDKHEEWLLEHDDQFEKQTAWQEQQDEHLQTHDRQLAEAASRLDDHDEELSKHQKELNDHLGRLNRQDARLDDHHERLEDHQAKLEEHEEWLEDHETRVTATESRIEDHEERLVDHKERLDGHDEWLENHETRVTAAEERIEDHKVRITTNEHDITGLKATDAQHDATLEIHHNRLNHHEEWLDEHDKELATIRQKDEEQDSQISALQQKDINLDQDIISLNSQTEALRKADQEIRTDLNTVNLNLQQAVACLSVFEEAAETASEEVYGIYTYLKSVYTIEAALTQAYQQVNTTRSNFNTILSQAISDKTITSAEIEQVKAAYATFNQAVQAYHTLHKAAEEKYLASRLEKKQNNLTNEDGTINLLDTPDGTTLISTSVMNIQKDTTGGTKILQVVSPVVSIETTSQTVYIGFESNQRVIKLINNSELEVIYSIGNAEAGPNLILKDFGVSVLILPKACSIELFNTGAGWRITHTFGFTFFPDLAESDREGDYVVKVNDNGTASTEQAENFIEVDESITSDLDLETLDEMFPEAMSGFQFICPTANTIYSKVSDLGGWIKYITTKVESKKTESDVI